MSKNNDTSVYRSGHKGGKILPALCSVSGTLILISVIAVCIPITVPKLMGYEIYDIVSGSMEPEIPVGSVIYVKAAAPEDIQEGDVIAFRRGYPQESGMGGMMSGVGDGREGFSGSGADGAGVSVPGGTGQDAFMGSGVNAQEGFSGSGAETGTEGMAPGSGTGADGMLPGTEGAVVCHRVVRNQIVEGWFETKGDANEQADMNKIPYDDLIGRVTYHIPVLGGVMSLLTGTVGKMYMVCFAACGAMLNMLAGRMREKDRRDLQQELEKELKETKGAL